MNPILKAALEYLDQGISVIPIRPRDKKPCIAWQEFQKRLPTEEELYAWFDDHPTRNLAIVCGPISGDLVVVDADGKDGNEWMRANMPTTTIYVKTPKNPFTWHGYFRGKGIRNSKPHPEVDIRGEGGYVVAPPSTHPNGGRYVLTILEGTEGWKSLTLLQSVSNLGKGLDLSSVKVAPTMEPKPEGSRNQTLAQLVGRWCQKGLDIPEIIALSQGWNATNPSPLPEKEFLRTVQSIVDTHNRNHPGCMVEDGSAELPEVDLFEDEAADIPAEVLNPGGLMQAIMHYTDRSNTVSVPSFALAGAIALMGVVCGQRIMTETGLRTNVYVVSIGYSGAGKNAACAAIPQLLLHSAREALGPTELASAQSLLKWLATEGKHVALVCVDELGMLLKGLRYPDSPKADMPRVLTRLFSSTDRPDVKSFADSKLNFTIPYHCCCLYGASTPNEFWKGLNIDDAASGFLARLLIFESRNKAPRPRLRTDPTPDPILAQAITDIWSIRPPLDPNRGNISGVPIPYVIPISSEAAWTWEPWTEKYFQLRNDYITDTTRSSIYGRAVEHAWKLALIHTASLYGAEVINGKEIGFESVTWATKLTDWLVERTIANANDCISDNEWHATQKKIIGIIKRIATVERPGASAREIKRVAHLPPRMFDDILQTLEQGGRIHRRQFKPIRGAEATLFCVSKDRK